MAAPGCCGTDAAQQCRIERVEIADILARTADDHHGQCAGSAGAQAGRVLIDVIVQLGGGLCHAGAGGLGNHGVSGQCPADR